MDRLLAVLGREFGERVRSRWFVLTTLFGPLLFAALTVGPPWLAYRSSRTVDPSALLVIDATTSGLGASVAQELAGGLSGTGTPPTVRVVPADSLSAELEALRPDLAAGNRTGVVVLDDATLSAGRIRVLLSGGAPLSAGQRVEGAVDRQIRRVRLAGAGVDPRIAEELSRFRVNANIERVNRDGGSASARVNLIFGFGVAMLLYVVIVLYGQIVLRGVTEEKQSRVAEMVLASVSPRILLSGKVLGIGSVALLQLSVWTSAIVVLLANRSRLLAKLGVQATDMQLPSIGLVDLIPLFAYFILGYVLYAALFAAVGSIVSSEQEAQQAQTPVIMLLVGSVALLQPALADPDGPIARTLGLVPFSSPIMMPLRMGITSVPVEEVVISICVLALTAVIAMLSAGRLYRTALLMHGKRPSVREVLRWIRRSDD